MSKRKPIHSVVDRAKSSDLGQIPKDTRDLTQRLFGDPLPGRSAYDQGARPTIDRKPDGPNRPNE